MPTKDGGFEILEPSNIGLQTLVRQGGSTSTNAYTIDPNEIPQNLKCAFSNTILRDASLLPCCGKVSYNIDILPLKYFVI